MPEAVQRGRQREGVALACPGPPQKTWKVNPYHLDLRPPAIQAGPENISVYDPWSVAFITTAVGDQDISDVSEGGVFR